MTTREIDARGMRSDALSDNDLDLVLGGNGNPGQGGGTGRGKPLHPGPPPRHVTLVTGTMTDGVYLGSA
jgi:hypothetical protein